MMIKTSVEEMNDFFNKSGSLIALITENDFVNYEGIELRGTDEFIQAQELLIKIGMRDTGITDIHREMARRKMRQVGRIPK